MSGIYGNPNPFNNQNPWGRPQNNWATQNQTQWPPQLKTNKLLVTSLDEAISKQAEPYSEMYYFDQSKPVFYIIRTDMNNVKSWVEIPYTVPNQENNTPVTQADLAELKAKIEALENKLTAKRTSKKEQEVEHNEPVGQSTI